MNPCKNIVWSEVEKKNVCKLGLLRACNKECMYYEEY